MNKLLEFFKKIPDGYYNWKKRNENLSKFLEEAESNKTQLGHIDHTINRLDENIKEVQEKIETLEGQLDQVNGRLDIIGKGTAMELFDTLHTWRVKLVVKQKWASPEQKREVEKLYHLYHNGCHANGQGTRYYDEIIALPESKEEAGLNEN